ncbi:(deoxy)nucleoside triphosphate pyrophosphohydrolase [Staphylococcus lutrae]|uniref:8-oxo-dGTP diphosphatase n=1 Tax=Staphylococcus lutrae TaxID=155085 RepID=A0AAC9RTV1_9STAP|nr:(deoxy)nucleoside triphosphate pyrophosphohydrolase [Staphylococcus lutrae]ARJ50690.1 DNA mismatch repair protein MutT [Staphylococcus lutrae]PNZ34738.1 (deoxy)nucleoside triphosphate pyrophosphohydrolase [Staphylococcus lutrae]
MKKTIHVVGAIIMDQDKVLCAQRSESMSLPLLWEFPGGKIEPGESKIEALKREIREEMACDLEIGAEVTTTEHEYDFAIIVLTTFRCKLKDTRPTLKEHRAIEWCDKAELHRLEWAPADIPAVDIIVSEA